MESKYFTVPQFSPVPTTDAADLPENIDLWLGKYPDRVKNFLRPDARGHKGYRFVKQEDFTETKEEIFKVVGVPCKFRFTRYMQGYDRLCPLYMGGSRVAVYVYIGSNGEVPIYHKYTTDNALLKAVREYKNLQKNGN